MSQDKYKDLSKEFDEEAIERTSGSQTGKGYDTTGIKYQYVINRLNEVLGIAGWDFDYEIEHRYKTTTSSDKTRYHVTVKTTLTVGDTVRACAGGHASMSYADALKGAITNALKKTAAFYGVGQQAYEGTIDDDNKAPQDAQTNTNGEKASKKQVVYIQKLMGMLNMDNEKFKEKNGLESMYDLTKSTASKVIEDLKERADDQNAFDQEEDEDDEFDIEF